MARVLIFLIFIFIFCQSFKLVPDMYEVYKCAIWNDKAWSDRKTVIHNDSENYSWTFCVRSYPICTYSAPVSIIVMTNLGHLLISVNSSANFLVYVASGTKFRQTLIKIFVNFTRRRTPTNSRFR